MDSLNFACRGGAWGQWLLGSQEDRGGTQRRADTRKGMLGEQMSVTVAQFGCVGVCVSFSQREEHRHDLNVEQVEWMCGGAERMREAEAWSPKDGPSAAKELDSTRMLMGLEELFGTPVEARRSSEELGRAVERQLPGELGRAVEQDSRAWVARRGRA
ncbi:hypothetical protein CYMTET_9393 [Cymbomonas tetramitiformis]|uniref:Uncharacterized protein n=1 Tax=Cymbomonas tetramitiformis TaxID=36881 RepID=A0AAE0LFI1_9CHLO|nr:hypothetical protein CYMTET_9393 [Cymbomonas tetramitiformis]